MGAAKNGVVPTNIVRVKRTWGYQYGIDTTTKMLLVPIMEVYRSPEVGRSMVANEGSYVWLYGDFFSLCLVGSRT